MDGVGKVEMNEEEEVGMETIMNHVKLPLSWFSLTCVSDLSPLSLSHSYRLTTAVKC